ncbi:MAG: OmpA family protein [Candidatus Omnitrophota bacterium]|jgi:chemotaxis protein MotB|nr:OmpA family protein [Candidatus Omnitrophota bacterium]MDD5526198.1 OmpA family protein [Candidatus Omnitrophota bacterium]
MFSKYLSAAVAALLTVSLFSGCTFIFQKGRRSDAQKIEQLAQQVDELGQAKKLLEDRLSQEIQDKQVRLERMGKGLVITFVADVLFDSGKATIRPEASASLDKVARVLQENVPDLNVGIEGHTDNIPIKVSGWKSNWELSSARALSVLHYLIDEKGVSPERLSAIGYGEYRPVASNDSKNGRQQNRRVEIVILPKMSKVADDAAGTPEPAQEAAEETAENLK